MNSAVVVQVKQPYFGNWAKVEDLFGKDVVNTSCFSTLQFLDTVGQFLHGEFLVKDGSVVWIGGVYLECVVLLSGGPSFHSR